MRSLVSWLRSQAAVARDAPASLATAVTVSEPPLRNGSREFAYGPSRRPMPGSQRSATMNFYVAKEKPCPSLL